MVNKNKEHVFVLPEDSADEQLATEFQARIYFSRQRQMYVLGVAGGWTKVLDEFEAVHVTEMTLNPLRFMVLLIDFDEDHNRLAKAKSVIPAALTNRVFVLGAWTRPEELKAALGSYSKIGSDLVEDCRLGTDKTWGTPLLKHNAGELDRLRQHVRSIFF